MGADIVDMLRDESRLCALQADGAWSALVNERENRLRSVLDRAAAEIGRLRGGVEALGMQLSDEVLIAKMAAPAMPSGVEGDRERGVREAAEYMLSEFVPTDHPKFSDLCRTLHRARLDALRAADNRDAAGVCGHVHPRHLGSPLDKNGCQLPAGHAGEHRFVDDAGRAVLWNYDKECQCVDCMSPDGGYECTVYRFETAVPTPAAVPAGEAVAWIKPDWQNPANYDGKSPVCTYPQAGWIPLYTTPPAAVQAAPQEGEAVAHVFAGAFGIHYIACADPNKLPVGTALYTRPLAAHPSACELGEKK